MDGPRHPGIAGPCMGFIADCYGDVDCAGGEVCADDVCELDTGGMSDAGVDDGGAI